MLTAPMDRETRARIESLVYRLRLLRFIGRSADVDTLARNYRLDPLMVHSLARAEGVDIDGEPASADTDPNQETLIMSRDGLLDDDDIAS